MLRTAIHVLRPLSLLLLATVARAGAAQSASPACRPVIGATLKQAATPRHTYQTKTSSAKGAKPAMGELISTSTTSYVLMAGRWRQIKITPQATVARLTANVQRAKVFSCQRLQDASVEGMSATVYKTHLENDDAKADTQLWVAKSTGLILREEVDRDMGDGVVHVSLHYSYANVQPPPGAK